MTSMLTTAQATLQSGWQSKGTTTVALPAGGPFVIDQTTDVVTAYFGVNGNSGPAVVAGTTYQASATTTGGGTVKVYLAWLDDAWGFVSEGGYLEGTGTVTTSMVAPAGASIGAFSVQGVSGTANMTGASVSDGAAAPAAGTAVIPDGVKAVLDQMMTSGDARFAEKVNLTDALTLDGGSGVKVAQSGQTVTLSTETRVVAATNTTGEKVVDNVGTNIGDDALFPYVFLPDSGKVLVQFWVWATGLTSGGILLASMYTPAGCSCDEIRVLESPNGRIGAAIVFTGPAGTEVPIVPRMYVYSGDGTGTATVKWGDGYGPVLIRVEQL